MKPTTFYLITYAIHVAIALTWVYFTGVMGLVIMILHWSFFNDRCFLTYVERYVHLKVLGQSRYILTDYRESLFYKTTKLF